MRKKPKEPKQLNPRIIEERNSIDGRMRWRVWLNGWAVAGMTRRPEEAIFDNQEEAEQYYADEYGWEKETEYQPEPIIDAPIQGRLTDRT